MFSEVVTENGEIDLPKQTRSTTSGLGASLERQVV